MQKKYTKTEFKIEKTTNKGIQKKEDIMPFIRMINKDHL